MKWLVVFLIIGTWLFAPIYSQRNNYPLIPEQDDHYWVFKDKHGKIIIDDNFREARWFPDDSANYHQVVTAVVRDIQTNPYKWAFMNTKGEYITDCIYDEVHYLKDGFLVEKDDKFAVIDKYGKFHSDFIYETAGYKPWYVFQFGLVPLSLGGKLGAIDIQGKVKIPFEYDEMDYSNQFFQVYKSGMEYHVYNVEGKRIFITDHWASYDLSDWACIVEKNDRYGLVGYHGEIILPVEHLHLSFVPGPEKYILASESFQGPNSILYDSTGKVICKTGYALSYPYLNGDRLLIHNKHPEYVYLQGIQRMNGDIVIPCFYKKLESTYNKSLLCVQDTMDKYGLIDTAGNVIIPCKFDSYISFFRDDPYCITSFNYENVVIDIKGNILFKIEGNAGETDGGYFTYAYGLFVFYDILHHHHYSEIISWVYTQAGDMILNHETDHHYVMVSHRQLLLYDEEAKLCIMNYNGDTIGLKEFEGISFIEGLEEIAICKDCEKTKTVNNTTEYYYEKGKVALVYSLDSVLVPAPSQTRLKTYLLLLMKKWTPSYDMRLRMASYIDPGWFKKEISKMKKISMKEFKEN